MSHHDEPQPWSRHALEHGGFAGFVPFSALTVADLPTAPGVYAVVRPSHDAPAFSGDSPAGRVKGKDPAVAVDVLAKRWVEGPEVLYIGTATLGSAGRRGLQKRIDEYRRNGAGEPTAHRGGRYIWQLEDCEDLLVAWNVTDEDAATVGSRMLDHFGERYGALPFANLRR
jgi:hypothetical protein